MGLLCFLSLIRNYSEDKRAEIPVSTTITITSSMLKRKDLSDFDNKVIINCGGVRHETYKVEDITVTSLYTWCTGRRL